VDTGVTKDKLDGSQSPTTSDDDDVYFKGSAEPTASDWNNLENYGMLYVYYFCIKLLLACKIEAGLFGLLSDNH
jgi:hypothetical protein